MNKKHYYFIDAKHGHYKRSKDKCRKEYGWHCRNTRYTIITRNNYLKMHGLPKHYRGQVYKIKEI